MSRASPVLLQLWRQLTTSVVQYQAARVSSSLFLLLGEVAHAFRPRGHQPSRHHPEMYYDERGSLRALPLNEAALRLVKTLLLSIRSQYPETLWVTSYLNQPWVSAERALRLTRKKLMPFPGRSGRNLESMKLLQLSRHAQSRFSTPSERLEVREQGVRCCATGSRKRLMSLLHRRNIGAHILSPNRYIVARSIEPERRLTTSIARLLERQIRILIYVGKLDSICTYQGRL